MWCSSTPPSRDRCCAHHLSKRSANRKQNGGGTSRRKGRTFWFWPMQRGITQVRPPLALHLGRDGRPCPAHIDAQHHVAQRRSRRSAYTIHSNVNAVEVLRSTEQCAVPLINRCARNATVARCLNDCHPTQPSRGRRGMGPQISERARETHRGGRPSRQQRDTLAASLLYNSRQSQCGKQSMRTKLLLLSGGAGSGARQRRVQAPAANTSMR